MTDTQHQITTETYTDIQHRGATEKDIDIQNQITKACTDGNLSLLKELTSKNDIFNVENNFTIACKNGHLEIVKYLIDNYQFDVHWNYDDAINNACVYGKLNVIVFLLENDRLHYNYEDVYNILFCACECGYLDVVKYFIENYNCDPHYDDNKAIVSACENNCLNVIKYLCETQKYYLNDIYSLFFCACKYGYLEIVEFIVENYNIDTHYKNNAAILSASKNGHLKIVIFLLQNDNSFKSYSMYKDTDIYNIASSACQRGHANIVKYLVENDYLTDASKLFMEQCKLENWDIVKIILEYSNLSPNMITDFAYKPALKSGIITILKMLVNNK